MRRLAAALAIGAMCAASPAALAQEAAVSAPPEIVRAPLGESVHDYYEGERASGWLWGGFGVVTLGVGGSLLAVDSDAARSAAVPLLAIGAIQTVVGIVQLTMTPPRMRRIEAELAADPAGFRSRDLLRMGGVHRSFLLVETIESVILVGGVITTGIGVAMDEDLARGAGIGMAIGAATMLFLDMLAHERATRYEGALR